MHSESNTKTDIIEENLKKIPNENKSRQNCVLLTTGSFNPIHHSHIKNLKLVKEFIENHEQHPMNVLAAYISPTHDGYVRGKLGESAWIDGKIRVELCEKAIKEEEQTDFIVVSRGELDYGHFVDFDSVSMKLSEYLNKKLEQPITVVYVCGLDHFNKCSYVEQLAKEKNMACAIIYRLGSNDEKIKSIERKLPEKIYYLTLTDEIQSDKLIDLSSTEIRNLFATSTTDEQYEKTIYKCVLEFYKNKHSQ